LKRVTEVLRFKVTLAEVKPAVWRRIEINASRTFWDLHIAVQDAMGWDDCHLHMFRVARPGSRKPVQIGLPDPDASTGPTACLPGWEVPLKRFFAKPGQEATYDYDFGDGWEHCILLEGILLADVAAAYPRCTAGERACPPEDVGGPYGYEQFLEAVMNPRHDEHRQMLAWVGGKFDPEAFDPARVRFDDPRRRLRVALRG
jgi:hypothetical protein